MDTRKAVFKSAGGNLIDGTITASEPGRIAFTLSRGDPPDFDLVWDEASATLTWIAAPNNPRAKRGVRACARQYLRRTNDRPVSRHRARAERAQRPRRVGEKVSEFFQPPLIGFPIPSGHEVGSRRTAPRPEPPNDAALLLYPGCGIGVQLSGVGCIACNPVYRSNERYAIFF